MFTDGTNEWKSEKIIFWNRGLRKSCNHNNQTYQNKLPVQVELFTKLSFLITVVDGRDSYDHLVFHGQKSVTFKTMKTYVT